jgi:hypothetical protein
MGRAQPGWTPCRCASLVRRQLCTVGPAIGTGSHVAHLTRFLVKEKPALAVLALDGPVTLGGEKSKLVHSILEGFCQDNAANHSRDCIDKCDFQRRLPLVFIGRCCWPNLFSCCAIVSPRPQSLKCKTERFGHVERRGGYAGGPSRLAFHA